MVDPSDRRFGAVAVVAHAFLIIRRRALALATVGLLVAVPAHLAVGGIGLRDFGASYAARPQPAEVLLTTLVDLLVVVPLAGVAATLLVVRAPQEQATGPGRALEFGLDRYPRTAATVALAALGIGGGLLLFVLPGIYLAVRWSLALPVVALEGLGPVSALRRSGELTAGAFWRASLVLACGWLLASAITLAIGAPFESLARSANDASWSLLGQALTSALAIPAYTVCTAVLYFDRRSNGALREAVDLGGGGQSGDGHE